MTSLDCMWLAPCDRDHIAHMQFQSETLRTLVAATVACFRCASVDAGALGVSVYRCVAVHQGLRCWKALNTLHICLFEQELRGVFISSVKSV